MDALIHRAFGEDSMPVEVLQAVRDLLARDSRPGQSLGATIDYLMDRLFYGEFQIFEQVSSNRYNDYVSLIGLKDPGTQEAPLWLVGHLGSGAEPVPSDWEATNGAPLTPKIDTHGGLLYGLGAANAKVDLLLKLLVTARLDTERLKRPVCLIGLSGDESNSPGLADLLDGRFPLPGAAFIGAPTNLELWTGHPGSVTVRLTARRTLRHRRMPPCRGMVAVTVSGRSAHPQAPNVGSDALTLGLQTLRTLRTHGDLRVLSFSAGEGSHRTAGRCHMQLATSFEALPDLPPYVEVDHLQDGAAVPLPIDKMMAGWLKAHDAGIAAARSLLKGGSCQPASRPRVDVHTGWMQSDRDSLVGEVTLWTGPDADQRVMLEAFAEAAHAQVGGRDESEIEVEVVQERPAFDGRGAAGELLLAGQGALRSAGLAPVVSSGRYVSDAACFEERGIPALLFGPGRGLGDLYQDNERIPLVHLDAAYRVYEALITQWCC
ncbi:MAG: M20/M25/M40 family metallo-hydrolase [Myxococcota bacterium]